MKNVEEEQYGAIHAAVPEEEWIKPKSNKVVVYHLKKEKFISYILGCLFLFVLLMGATVGILQVNTVSLEQLPGSNA